MYKIHAQQDLKPLVFSPTLRRGLQVLGKCSQAEKYVQGKQSTANFLIDPLRVGITRCRLVTWPKVKQLSAVKSDNLCHLVTKTSADDLMSRLLEFTSSWLEGRKQFLFSRFGNVLLAFTEVTAKWAGHRNCNVRIKFPPRVLSFNLIPN